MIPQLPNLIVIGAMKAGTTSLHHYLNLHPDIFMSDIKEPHFFVEEQNLKKGIEWYKNLFVTDKPVRGESSQGYTKRHSEKGIAKRIKETLPDVKLIYILRDPIERIISHATEYFTEVNRIEDINKGLSKNFDAHIVKTSMYFYQITEYLQYFDISQIHFLTLENLKDNRLEEMNKIFDFLELERIKDTEIFSFEKNTNQDKVIKKGIVEKFEKSSIKNLVKKTFRIKDFSRIKSSKLYKKMFTKHVEKPVLNTQIEKQLVEYLKEDVRKMSKLTGLSFDNWKHKY